MWFPVSNLWNQRVPKPRSSMSSCVQPRSRRNRRMFFATWRSTLREYGSRSSCFFTLPVSEHVLQRTTTAQGRVMKFRIGSVRVNLVRLRRAKVKQASLYCIATISMILASCGGADTATAPSTNSGGPGSGSQHESVEPVSPAIGSHALATIVSEGSTVAHIISFGAAEVWVYIPSADKYAYVDLATGNYLGWITYWSDANCSGTTFATSYIGEAGKTIQYDSYRSKYFLVTSAIPVGTPLQYQSTSYLGACTNAVNGPYTLNATRGAAQLSETARPFNFNALAPLTVTFP